MKITETQKRLMNLIDKHHDTYNRAYGLALYNGANPEEVADSYHLALWFEGAEAGVKNQLLSIFDSSYCDVGLRVCDACGKFMTEGYLLFGLDHYACSRECAIKVFQWNGLGLITPGEAEKRLDRALEEEENDNFWTEWYQEL
jgi:hypothetical protein